MNDMTAAERHPGLGHNLPPSPLEERQLRTDELIENANVWLAQCAEIKSDAQAGRADDLRSLIRQANKTNEEQRKAEAAPHRAEVDRINGGYKGLAALLDAANDTLKRLLQPWLRKKEAERIAQAKAEREEAAQLQREADEKAREATTIQDEVQADELSAQAEEKSRQAAATARSHAQVHGEVSGRATSLRSVWKATSITDLNIAFSAYSEHPDITAVLLKLASAEARGGRRRIPGFQIEQITSVA